jgi:hypothetical protein
MDTHAAAIAGLEAQPTKNTSKAMLWAGRILSALPILMLLMSASMKLTHQPQVIDMLSKQLGYAESAITGIGLLELVCVVLYAIPATSLFGAVLMTAYLGGAVASHVRVAEGFAPPVFLAILAWLGLYLRDRRLRDLLPFRGR